MNSVEQAIRAALAKGDANDEAFRNRIFSSASAALERSLLARAFSEQEIVARRNGLATTIKHIESEFELAIEPDVPLAEPDIQHFKNVVQPAQSEVVPPHKKQKNPYLSARNEHQNVKRFTVNTPRSKRRWLNYTLNIGFLLALFFAGVWAYWEGKKLYENATAPNGLKPPLAEIGKADSVENTDWVQVFSANDTDLITAPQGAKAEIASRDGANFVIFSSNAGQEISVKIGSGLVQTFAGKRVLFNIKARSVDGSTLDTGAHCSFGPETKCERKRFKLGPQSIEFMFAVSVAASASGDGALLIAPNLGGSGGMVEIESIRATIVQPDAG